MRPVKHSSFSKQTDPDTRTFALADFRAKLDKESFDIRPVDIAARWSGKYQF